ncbi:bacterial surface protein [Lachnospiraceae bacterium KM106-2]|nr:bacterial surface protein [Lachnospiraceae bacterium KM106-2]
MRQRIRPFLVLFILAVVIVMIQSSTVDAASKKVSLCKKAYVSKGEILQLKLKRAKAGKVKWTKKGNQIVISKKGVVSGKKKGSAIVIAQYGKKKYKCRVYVEVPKLSKSLVKLTVGSSTRILLQGTKRAGGWKTSNAKVITVSKGRIKALAPGKAAVSVKVGKKQYRCNVRVLDKDSKKESIPVQSDYTFNGCKISSFGVERERASATAYEYYFHGIITNTSPYLLSGITVLCNEYLADGTMVNKCMIFDMNSTVEPGQPYFKEEEQKSNYDITKFEIVEIHPMFQNQEEKIDVSGIECPKDGSMIVPGIYLDHFLLSGKHSYASFDTFEAKVSLVLHYDPIAKDRGIQIHIKFLDSNGQVVKVDSNYIQLMDVSTTSAREYTIQDVPINTKRIVIEMTDA